MSKSAATSPRINVNIPDGLTDLLQNFTVTVLREQPRDLLAFAASYFKKELEQRSLESPGGSAPQFNHFNGDQDHNRREVNYDAERRVSSESEAGFVLPRLEVERPVHSDDDESDEEPFTPPVGFNRRKSVAAERYDPEADDDDDNEDKCIHPKSDEQRKRLLKAIDGIFLFRNLDATQLQDAVDAMFEKKVEADEHIIKQGDDGDNFYVIDSGKYDIYVNMDSSTEELGEHKGTIEDHGFFGELALMYNQPRAATIRAKTNGSIWALDRNTFRRIVLKSAFKKRQLYEDIIASVPMLSTLEAYERMNLCDALVHRSFPSDVEIVTQGDRGESMFFIENGHLVVTAHQNGDEEREITRLNRGQYFGELALVTKKPRAATVKSEGPVNLAELDVNAFERLLGPCMGVMQRNIDAYKQQMQDIFGDQEDEELDNIRR